MGKAKLQDLYAVIHITRKAIWGDVRDEYENMLNNFYGAGSSSDLSYREKLDFIDRLKAIEQGNPQPKINRRRGLWATHGQIKKIDALAGTPGWDTEGRLTGFIKKQTQKNKTKWMLTGKESTKVIIGLQRIIAGNNKELYSWLNTATAELIGSNWGQQKIKQLHN